ncbi:MAG: flagellar biosynthesis protein FlhB [Limnochordia bacterium]|jgi:flagellar biosynthetic protein FlhB
MPPDVGGERTEPATPKRRQEVRKKGQFARTAELGPALILLGAYAVLKSRGRAMGEAAVRMLRYGISAAAESEALTPSTVGALLIPQVVAAGKILGPLLVATAGAALAGQLFQVGFVLASVPLKPDWHRVNPLEGMKRLLSRRALVELVRSLLKVGAIGLLGWPVLRETLLAVPEWMESSPAQAAAATGALVGRLTTRVGAAFVVVAVADYIYQRWDHEKSIRMTRKEVEEELRESEGDPQIRGRIRQRQRKLAMSRMLKEVERADVVVTNPVHVAVALRYDAERMAAPVITARGAGELAQRIKQVAEQHRVPVVRHETLARGLYYGADVGEQVPLELFQAVAEVLAYVYRLRGRNGRQ